MKINRWLVALVATLCFWSCVTAQKVERYSVSTLKENRVVYTLPLTQLYLDVQLQMEVEQPGELSLYAERYLGSGNAILKPSTKYKITGVELGAYGLPDPNQRYSIEFKKNSTASNVSLTEEGILLGINSNVGEKLQQLPASRKAIIEKPAAKESSNLMLPPEYIQATTIAAKAQILADEIFRTRESRNLVISGESEQPFADGEALKIAVERLDQREKAFVEYFEGTRYYATGNEVISAISATEEGRRVVARFSEQLGLLGADDLRGEPLYLEIEVTEEAHPLDERDQKKLEKRLEKGITYRIPGMIKASITFRNQQLLAKEIAVAQLGSLEALNMVLFTTKGKNPSVTFHPSNGGLKEVSETAQ